MDPQINPSMTAPPRGWTYYAQWAMGLAALSAFAMVMEYQVTWQQRSINDSARQAHAFLHGRLDVGHQGHDLALYNGKWYVPYPPLPSALLVPAVAALGVEHTSVPAVALLLTAIGLWALGAILRRLDVPRPMAFYLQAAFFLGTGYWFCLSQCAGVYFFAHVVAVTCLLLGLLEMLGKRRGWAMGLCVGLAFLSRQMTLAAALPMLLALWTDPHRRGRSRWANLTGFALTLGLCIACCLAVNYAKFDHPFETGYRYIQHHGGFLQARFREHGLFSWVYVPFNFFCMFLQGPVIQGAPPFITPTEMSPFGTAITFASPFVFLAFAARAPRWLAWGVWASVTPILAALMFYYNNGWVQTNCQRFTLDFLPILMLLVALGSRRLPPLWIKGLTIYSVSLNILALVILPALANLTK